MSDEPICPFCGDGPEALGTMYHIECVEKLMERITELGAEVERLRKTTIKGVPAGVDYELYYDKYMDAKAHIEEWRATTKAIADERDRAKAELEAEVARMDAFCKEFIWGEDNPVEYRTLFERAEQAEAELAALRAGHCTNPYFDHGTPCDRWVAREEEK